MRANKPLRTIATPSGPTTMPHGRQYHRDAHRQARDDEHEPDDHGNHVTEKVVSQREKVPEL